MLRVRVSVPLLLGFLAPGFAWAGSVAITPLIPKGVDEKVAVNITGLLSSELDFSGAYDSVVEVAPMPATLNAACLASTSCLGAITKGNGADALVAGSVGPGPDGIQLYLVLYDGTKNTIVRKKTFNSPADPGSIATNATAMVKELVTGENPSAAKAEAESEKFVVTADTSDDFAFDAPAPPPKSTTSTKSSSSTSKTTKSVAPPPPKPLEDEEEFLEPEDAERAEAAKREAEEEAQRRIDDAARAKSEAAARAKAAAEERAREEERERREAADRVRQEEEAQARREAEDARRAEEEEAAEAQERAAAAAAAKARAAAEARAEAEAAARAKTTASKPKTSDEEFSFGSSAGDIAIEIEDEDAVAEVEEDLEEEPVRAPAKTSYYSSAKTTTRVEPEEDLDEPTPAKTSTSKSSSAYYSSRNDADDDRPAPSRTATSTRYDEDEDLDAIEELEEPEEPEERPTRSRYEDLEEDEPASRSSSSSSKSSTSASRSSSASSKSSSKDDRYEDLDGDRRSGSSSSSRSSSVRMEEESDGGVSVAGRAGYAKYYSFDFITYGAEVAVPVATSVVFVVGVEGFSTQRELTTEMVEQIATEQQLNPNEIDRNPWNTILPINAGIQYKSMSGAIHPYVGADFTATVYTAKPDFAFGGRVRLGVDFMVADVFGFNLNASGGIMSGSEFDQTETGVKNTGLVPQISAGTVFQF